MLNQQQSYEYLPKSPSTIYKFPFCRILINKEIYSILDKQMVPASCLLDISRSQAINLFFRYQVLTNNHQKRKCCSISLLGAVSAFIIKSQRSLQKENTLLSQEFKGYEMLLRFLQNRKGLSSFRFLKNTYWKAEVRRDSIYTCVTGQHKVK